MCVCIFECVKKTTQILKCNFAYVCVQHMWSALSAEVHVVIGHGGTWKPVVHCALYSSDGLSCSLAHFMFSISAYGWEAFFSLQLYEIIEMENVLFIFCRKKRIPSASKALSFFSGAEPDH